MPRHLGVLVLLVAVNSANIPAQEPVRVGKGSYAASPPPAAGKPAAEMTARHFPLVGKADRPIPTNKLWTWLLNGKASGSLWMYPWRVDPKETGVNLFLPIKWNANGSDPVCDSPLTVEGVDFRATGLFVKDWGDWTLSFRLPQSEDAYLDITVGEGMPVVWVESHGMGIALKAGREASFAQADGQELRFPSTDDRVVVSSAGRLYGVFVPPGTRLVRDGEAVRLNFPAEKSSVAIAAIKHPQDLALVAKCAYPSRATAAWTGSTMRLAGRSRRHGP